MKTSALKLTNDGVTLTTYLLDSSTDMPNTRVRPAILIFPGGAYRVCSDREAKSIAMAFLAEGYHAFVEGDPCIQQGTLGNEGVRTSSKGPPLNREITVEQAVAFAQN